MTINDFGGILAQAVDGHAYHYRAPADNAVYPLYIVWGETGEAANLSADDVKTELVMRVEVYLYAQEEFPKALDTLCTALNDAGISWRIESIGYDDGLNTLVYQLGAEVCCGTGSVYS